jgi:Arc/MetJ-type ribon-helix-helix transcriptional regulator
MTNPEHPRGFPPPIHVRYPVELVERVDALIERMSTPGARVSRSSILIAAVEAGLGSLEKKAARRSK